MLEGTCCESTKPNELAGVQLQPFPMQPEQEEVCCGAPAGPPSSPFEKPGYRIASYVEKFLETKAGPVPMIRTNLTPVDWMGTTMVRIGMNRNDYKVPPGLYSVGSPTPNDPVLVTANYKLSFDAVRKALAETGLWLLVLDTRGINVWCAAGKGTFGTDELVSRVRLSGLEKVVNHRKLVLPQLGATGVSARQVKKQCGFEVVWGPVRAADLPAFLQDDMKAVESMRRVTFTLLERLVLIPVEISISLKPLLRSIIAVFVLSGIGSSFFSIQAAYQRGLLAIVALLGGVLSGAVLTPAFLNKLPGRAFSGKGAIAGAVTAMPLIIWFWGGMTGLEKGAFFLLLVTVSSFLAMNFTGTTPFTSPTGVEKEMRKAIPLQLAALVLAAILWISAGFR